MDDGTISADDPRIEAVALRLFDLARHGRRELLDLVDEGVPADLTDGAGNTLLMLAAYHGHVQVVEGLIARAASVDALNAKGQSPLAGAVFKGDLTMVRTLLMAGADPEAGAPTATQTALLFGRDELLEIIEGSTNG